MWAKLSFLAFITALKNNYATASSLFEIETLSQDIELDTLPVSISQAEYDRSLQSCTPAHDNSGATRFAGRFLDMFYDEEIWTAPDVEAPMVLRWDLTSCEMVIGRHEPPEESFMTSQIGGGIVKQFDNIDDAYYFMHNDHNGAYFRMMRLDINGTSMQPTGQILFNGVPQPNWPRFAYDSGVAYNAGMAAYSQDAIQFKFTRQEVFDKLLTGRAAAVKMADTSDDTATNLARLVNRNQIRIIDRDGFYYINRKNVHSTSGLTYSSHFLELHNAEGGGLNPTFSICENIDSSNQPPYSASAEVGLCCGGQCSYDMTKVYKSTLCHVPVNNCYNPLLDNCSVETIPCEHIIAEPEDQMHALFPSDRSPVPSDNTWTFFGVQDFTGGINNGLYKYIKGSGSTSEKNTEVRTSIPFNGAGDGNGRYQINFWITNYGNLGSASTNRVRLQVKSYSTGEVLAQRTVTSGMLTHATFLPITLEATIADRHLNDIGLKLLSLSSLHTAIDFVEVKYMYHETLSPTPYPTPRPTPHPTPQPTPPPCTTATIELKTDNYPGEISWNWQQDGVTINSVARGYYGTNLHLYRHYVPLCTGRCYRFIIYDSASDGICCGYGSGWYKVIAGGSTRMTGASYSSSSQGTMCW